MNWNEEVLLSNPKMLRHILIISLGFILGVSVASFTASQQFRFDLHIIMSGALGISASYIALNIGNFLDDLVPWEKQAGGRLFVGIVGMSIIIICWTFICIYSFRMLGLVEKESGLGRDILIKIQILILIIVLIFNVFYFIFYSYQHYASGQVKAEILERKSLHLQLRILKAQLSPHFLFNSLNVLSSLFPKDKALSEQFIRSLAHTYHYITHHNEKPLVKIKDELQFLTSYFKMIRIRYQDMVDLDVELSKPILESKVPPMTLQILLENAVKHNYISHDKPLKIKVKSENGYITFWNNLNPKDGGGRSTGIGLQNVIERYELLTPNKVTIEKGEHFKVSIPVLT